MHWIDNWAYSELFSTKICGHTDIIGVSWFRLQITNRKDIFIDQSVLYIQFVNVVECNLKWIKENRKDFVKNWFRFLFRYRDKMDSKNYGGILSKEETLAKIWWLFFKNGMYFVIIYYIMTVYVHRAISITETRGVRRSQKFW